MYESIPDNQVVVWNNCSRTLFAAMKRHVAAVPLPKPALVAKFNAYVDRIIADLYEHLVDFDYSYSQWYNHLNARQQADIDNSDVDLLDQNRPMKFSMFCKREIQAMEGLTFPKNRAIAGPNGFDKNVLGPVSWALEDLFSQHLVGYCGGKNWEVLEELIAQNYKDGYQYLVQGDGSGFDRTQSHELKYFDRKIYEIVAQNVYHVEKDVFLTKATSRYRTLEGTFFSAGKNILCKALVDATVTSGSPDTTLMNTARMSLYVGFMAYEAQVDARWLAKGDDFVMFIKSEADYDKLKTQFEKYWAEKNTHLNEEFGLGLILKFIKFSDYTGFDFCSTHLICDFNNNLFKIVRQWDRILDLGAYSMKALAYSKGQKNQYVSDLMDAMQDWTQGMPFYKEYILEYRRLYSGVKTSVGKVGKSKKILPDDLHRGVRTQFLVSQTNYGRDFDYARHERKSKLRIDDDVVKQFFYDKYGLVYSEQPWRLC